MCHDQMRYLSMRVQRTATCLRQAWLAGLVCSSLVYVPVSLVFGATEPEPFNVPAQSVDTASAASPDQNQLQLRYDDEGVKARPSNPVPDRHDPEEAVNQFAQVTDATGQVTVQNTDTAETLPSPADENEAREARTSEASPAADEPPSGTEESEPPLVKAEPVVVKDVRQTDFRVDTSSTATNVDAPQIETPATVNTITKDFLNTIQTRQFEDVLDYVPGAAVNSKGFRTDDEMFSLRGFTTNSRFGGGIYVDRFIAPRRSYHFDRSLYEQVDVLKGTSGLLFGVNSPGGIVNYVTKRPKFEAALSVEASGGTGPYNQFRSTLDATGPLNENRTLAYRVIVTRHDGRRTVHGDDDDGKFNDDYNLVNPQLAWKAPTGGTLNLSYEYHQMDSSADLGITRLHSGEYQFNTSFVGPANGLETKQHMGTVDFTQPLWENWEVFLGAKFIRSETDNLFDGAGAFGPPDGVTPLPRFHANNRDENEQSEYRLVVNGRINTGEHVEHQLTVGYTRAETETILQQRFAFPMPPFTIDPLNPVITGPAPPLPPFFPPSPFRNDEHRLYFQDYVTLYEKLKVFGGVSYLDYEVGSGTQVNEDQVINWSLGAIYNYNDWLNPFVSYSTSTESQFGLLEGGGTVPARDADQIEAGLKSEWFDHLLLTTLSVFQIEQTNIAQGLPPPSIFSILVGDQRTRGFEFEATGRITDQISVYGGYSFLDAEFTRSTSGNQGSAPHSVPKHKFSLFTQYAFADALDGLTVGAGIVHVGERWGDNTNTFKLPNYERIDLTMGYRRGAFRFQGTVENLLNTDYITGSGFPGPANLQQGMPRFITLNFGWDF